MSERRSDRRGQASVLVLSALVVSAFVGVGAVAAVTDTGMVYDTNLNQANNDGQIGLCQWVEVERLLAPVDPSQNGFNVEFGRSVAVDGETGVVGAVGFSGLTDAVYVYDLSSPSSTPTKLTASDGAANDVFGVSIAVSGDTVVVGASAHDAVGEDSGAVYVYDLTQSPPAETKFTATDAAAGDRFGASVALDGETLVVGAPGADDSTGAVYVYDVTQSSPTALKLTASDGNAGDRFGSSVAVSGETVAVGALSAGTAGAAYVYDLTGSTPTETKLPAGLAGIGLFGESVGISGETVVVGAPGDGSAFVYDLTQSPPTATVLADGTGFGGAVAASGETVVVGSSGAVAIYDLSSTHPTVPVAEATGVADPLLGTFGASVAVDEETALVGTAGSEVFVYRCVDQ